MQISFNWLKNFVPFQAAPQELAHRLTMVGLEVTDIRYLGQGLETVVVGEIKEVKSHPNSDHLFICEVDAGGQEYSVVCGAPNTRRGLKSAFIPAGKTLPTGLAVKKAKIRGVESYGLLCSERELGISTDHSGIIELAEECRNGQSIIEAMGLEDYALEFDLTTNRSDALSHYGIAREIATAYNLTLKPVEIAVEEGNTEIQSLVKVTIDNPSSCPRYTARLITGVKIGPSPHWLQQRLLAAGQRPINNVVDVTNYVLLELGHPLHAFDYDLLTGHHIIVRHAGEGEKFTTLDGIEYTLSSEVLMIADEKNSVAVGGIMGGLDSEVTDTTSNILLESACFNPKTIRAGSRFLNKRTESSLRFEKGTDPENAILAQNRAAQLIVDVAGGQIAKNVIDAYPRPIPMRKTQLRLAQVKRVLGVNVPEEMIFGYLTTLGFAIDRNGKKQNDFLSDKVWDITIPNYRPDVQVEIDLIEEIARHFGYDNIPDRLTSGSGSQDLITKNEKVANLIRQTLVGLGYTEFLTNSFVDDSIFNRLPQFGIDADSFPLIKIKNPLTADHNCLRPSLLMTVLAQVQKNINQKNADLKVFEIGRVFEYSALEKGQVTETDILGLFLNGISVEKIWEPDEQKTTFYDLKGTVEDLLSILRISDFEFRPASRSYFHPMRCAEIVIKGEIVGTIGELISNMKNEFDIESAAYWAEFRLQNLIESTSLVTHYNKLPRYPAIERDLALVIDNGMLVQPIINSIKKLADEHLEKLNIFDIYKGPSLPSGKKSVAFSLTFRSGERTLVDNEIDRIIERILYTLKKEFRVTLRS